MDDEGVILTFRAPPPKERVARYAGGLVGPRGALFLGAALAPGFLLLVLDANPPFPAWALGLGLGLFVFGILAGALAAFAQKPYESVVVLALDGVRETVGDRTIDRGWGWVERAIEGEDTIALHVRADAMKSLRLGTPAPRILLVDKRTTPRETVLALRSLLARR